MIWNWHKQRREAGENVYLLFVYECVFVSFSVSKQMYPMYSLSLFLCLCLSVLCVYACYDARACAFPFLVKICYES